MAETSAAGTATETAPAEATDTATESQTETQTEATIQPESTDWRSNLPDDLKGSETLARFQGKTADEVVPELAKSYLEARTLVGADAVKVPGKDATDEQKAEFFNKIGRPEQADGYEFPTEGIPEGFGLPDESQKLLRETFHKIGLTKNQAAQLYRQLATTTHEGQQLQEQAKNEARQKNMTALQTEYGDALEERVNLSMKSIQEFGDDDLKTLLNDTVLSDGSVLGDHPAMVRFAAAVGRAVAEDEIKGSGAGAGLKMSPVEAKAEIAKLESDPEVMAILENRSHPQYKAMVDRIAKLNLTANPGKSINI